MTPLDALRGLVIDGVLARKNLKVNDKNNND
jgi:hypothetical protein